MTWLLYEKGAIDAEEILKRMIPLFTDVRLMHCHEVKAIEQISAGDLIIAYTSLEILRNAVTMVASKDAILGVLPREENHLFIQAFALPKKIDDALAFLVKKNASKVDLLHVNGISVFSHVTIGQMSRLRPQTQNGNAPTIKEKFKTVLRSLYKLGELRFQPVTMKSAKGQTVQTAVMGITLIENSNSPMLRHVFVDELDSYDGQLNAFIWAPRSVMALLWYWLRLTVLGKIKTGALPKSIGFIQTKQLTISSSRPIEFSIDGTDLAAKELEAEVLPAFLSLVHGNKEDIFELPQEEKERFKVAHLPKGDAAIELSVEPLPLFSHAGEDDFRELFLQLRESATGHKSFYILMVLSTILSSMGLFLNSSSVIIGAMILAPLMAPIISLSMATARNDHQLIGKSVQTLAMGIGLSIVVAALISALMPLELVTAEMRSRLHPNVLDLFVAIISGIAGAYAYAKEEIAKSLPGVAIAVALVPPLTVTGSGVGFMDWNIVSGSFLLFLTNLVGIVIAASITFFMLGYAPLKMAKKGLGVTSLLLLLLIPPLMIGFFSMTLQSRVAKELINRTVKAGSNRAIIENASVIHVQPLELALRLSVDEPLSSLECDILKNEVQNSLAQEVRLRLSYEIVR